MYYELIGRAFNYCNVRRSADVVVFIVAVIIASSGSNSAQAWVLINIEDKVVVSDDLTSPTELNAEGGRATVECLQDPELLGIVGSITCFIND